jgi:hypothetical protein
MLFLQFAELLVVLQENFLNERTESMSHSGESM